MSGILDTRCGSECIVVARLCPICIVFCDKNAGQRIRG